MKKQAAFTLTLVILLTGTTYANNLPPVAVIEHDVNRDFFFAGETITFDGTGSYDRDEGGSSIYSYMWTIDGAYYYSSTVSLSFSLPPGQSSRTVTVKLKVRDDELVWSPEITKTYTLRAGQDRHFYLKDHLGSVRVTVDEQGEPIGYDDYYPYGLQMPTRSSNTSNPNDRYKFTGHERDTEAGLTFDYMGARTYDPLLGIFMQIDPLMEFSTPYSYVGANPVNLTDPTGMSSECARRGTGSVSIDGGVPVCGDLDYEVMEEGEIKKKESKNKEQPEPEPPNYYDLNDDERGQLIVDYLIQLAEEGRNVGNLFEIFSFERDGQILAPGSSSGMFNIKAYVEVGEFKGNIEMRFTGVDNLIRSKEHHIFSAHAPSFKGTEIRTRDSQGKLTGRGMQYSTTFASHPETNSIVFVLSVLGNTKQAQAFANAVISPMRRSIPPH